MDGELFSMNAVKQSQINGFHFALFSFTCCSQASENLSETVSVIQCALQYCPELAQCQNHAPEIHIWGSPSDSNCPAVMKTQDYTVSGKIKVSTCFRQENLTSRNICMVILSMCIGDSMEMNQSQHTLESALVIAHLSRSY